MSLLTDASLLLTPNAYKEGKLYSVIPSNGNGDFTATRATTATRVNSAGLVDLVPYNLLTWSEMFTDASWSKNSVSISSNVATAPNGTLTADKLIEDTANTNHWTFQTYTGISQSLTASCYFKKSEREWAFIRIRTTSGDRYAYFNLNTGTLGTIESPLTATITSADNGWYRCSVTTTIPNPSTNPIVLGLTTADNIRSYTGDGTSGLFIWGAQLVEGTSARDYLRTETRLNIPRVDYSLGGCPNVLLEPQRTNNVRSSEDLTQLVWSKNAGVTITADSSTSPSGVQNADRVIGATAPTAWGAANTLNQQVGGLTINTLYTSTIYLRSSTTSSQVTLSLRDQSTGSINSVVCNLTSSWQRFEISRTTGAATTALGIMLAAATSDFFAWGAQLEAGAYATSYIPTTTASVTRNADSITRNNIFTNGLITAAGGTWFVELRNNVARIRDTVSQGLFLASATGLGNGFCLRTVGFDRLSINKIINDLNTFLYITTTNTVKIAIKWNGTTADVFVNGTKVVSATAFTATNMDTIGTATNIIFNINEMALFPTPLTDAQCIALTQ